MHHWALWRTTWLLIHGFGAKRWCLGVSFVCLSVCLSNMLLTPHSSSWLWNEWKSCRASHRQTVTSLSLENVQPVQCTVCMVQYVDGRTTEQASDGRKDGTAAAQKYLKIRRARGGTTQHTLAFRHFEHTRTNPNFSSRATYRAAIDTARFHVFQEQQNPYLILATPHSKHPYTFTMVRQSHQHTLGIHEWLNHRLRVISKQVDWFNHQEELRPMLALALDHALVLSSALFIPVLYRSSNANANGYDCAINSQHIRTKKALDAIQIILKCKFKWIKQFFQFQFLTRISIQFFFKISNNVYTTCPYSFITVHRSIHSRWNQQHLWRLQASKEWTQRSIIHHLQNER